MELNQSEIDTYQEAESSDEAHGQAPAMVYKPNDWPFYERTEYNGMLVEKRETGKYLNGKRVSFKQLADIAGISKSTINARANEGRPLSEWLLPPSDAQYQNRKPISRHYVSGLGEGNNLSSKMLRARLI